MSVMEPINILVSDSYTLKNRSDTSLYPLQQQYDSDVGLAWTDAIHDCFEMMLHHFKIYHTVVANCSGEDKVCSPSLDQDFLPSSQR